MCKKKKEKEKPKTLTKTPNHPTHLKESLKWRWVTPSFKLAGVLRLTLENKQIKKMGF
jgi:hypothetical protein